MEIYNFLSDPKMSRRFPLIDWGGFDYYSTEKKIKHRSIQF